MMLWWFYLPMEGKNWRFIHGYWWWCYGDFLWYLSSRYGDMNGKSYPLVICYIAIENGNWNSGFSHSKWWFSIVFCMFTRGYIDLPLPKIRGGPSLLAWDKPKPWGKLQWFQATMPLQFLATEIAGISTIPNRTQWKTNRYYDLLYHQLIPAGHDIQLRVPLNITQCITALFLIYLLIWHDQ